MNVEIVEFYPLEQKEGLITGTLRVRLPEIGIHILGIYVSKKKDFWFFNLPGRKGSHHESGESTWYPFVAFESREMQRQFISAIREKGQAFIEDYIKTHPQAQETKSPTKAPQFPAKQKEINGANPTQKKAIMTEPTPIRVTGKQWVDPPQRKKILAKSNKRN